MREYQVRICERLGVKFPGPTRQKRQSGGVRVTSALPRKAETGLARGRVIGYALERRGTAVRFAVDIEGAPDCAHGLRCR